MVSMIKYEKDGMFIKEIMPDGSVNVYFYLYSTNKSINEDKIKIGQFCCIYNETKGQFISTSRTTKLSNNVYFMMYNYRDIIHIKKLFNADNIIIVPFDNMNYETLLMSLCNYLGFNNDIYKLKTRKSEFVALRHVLAYIMRNYTDIKLTNLAHLFNKDHSTMLHSERMASGMIDLIKNNVIKYQISNEYTERFTYFYEKSNEYIAQLTKQIINEKIKQK